MHLGPLLGYLPCKGKHRQRALYARRGGVRVVPTKVTVQGRPNTHVALCEANFKSVRRAEVRVRDVYRMCYANVPP